MALVSVIYCSSYWADWNQSVLIVSILRVKSDKRRIQVHLEVTHSRYIFIYRSNTHSEFYSECTAKQASLQSFHIKNLEIEIGKQRPGINRPWHSWSLIIDARKPFLTFGYCFFEFIVLMMAVGRWPFVHLNTFAWKSGCCGDSASARPWTHCEIKKQIASRDFSCWTDKTIWHVLFGKLQ